MAVADVSRDVVCEVESGGLPAVLVFVVALAVRLVHVWQIAPSPFFEVLLGDAHGYDEWGRRIAGGEWIGTEVFYQAPLYPYFLGALYTLTGHNLLIVRLVQALFGAGSSALLCLAGSRLFSARVGLLAGLGLALYAPAVFFDGLLQKSVLDMFFVCLSIWLISRLLTGPSAAIWLALGLSMGALSLTRENALVFIIVLMMWATTQVQKGSEGFRQVLRGSLVPFLVGLVIVLVPVVARNAAVGGGLYLTTSQFGTNFYIGNNPHADGTYASIRFGRGAPEYERQDATSVAEHARNRTLTPTEVSSYWTGQTLEFITSQPGAWLRLMVRKIVLLVNRSEMLDTESQESYAEWSWPLRLGGPITHFGLLVPLALFGAILMWPRRKRLWVLYAMTVSYAASVVLFYVFARYRFPLVPFLLLFASAGLVDAPAFFKRTRLAMSGSVVVATVVMLVLANWPLLSADLMRAITENNLGTALQDQKQYDQAILHHQRAIALQPGYAPAHNNLGAALRASGRLDDAVESYRRALAINPGFGDASYNLANALLEQGQAGASADQFRKAIESSPESVQAHNNLGIALAAKGDTAGAMAEFRAALAIDDGSVQAHRNLGNMLVDAGNRAEGLAHLERAVQVAPGEAEASYDIGSILLAENNFVGAADRFRAAIRVKPEWAGAHNNLGISLASRGQFDEAIEEFRRALTINPSMADAKQNLETALRARK